MPAPRPAYAARSSHPARLRPVKADMPAHTQKIRTNHNSPASSLARQVGPDRSVTAHDYRHRGRISAGSLVAAGTLGTALVGLCIRAALFGELTLAGAWTYLLWLQSNPAELLGGILPFALIGYLAANFANRYAK